MRSILYTFHTCLVFFMFLFMICPQIAYSEASEGVYKNIPLFDLTKERHSLQIKVKESVYVSEEFIDIPENISTNSGLGEDSAEEALAKYLFYLTTKQFDKVLSLYHSNEETEYSVEIAKFTAAARLKLVNKFKFIKKWYYKDFIFVMVELSRTNGKTDFMGLWFKDVNDKYYCSDHWDNIVSLLEHMVVDYNENLVSKHNSRKFMYSLMIGDEGNNPVTIYFDGELHDYISDWTELEKLEEDKNNAMTYLHEVMIKIPEMNDNEFLNLWHGEDKDRKSQDYIRNAGSCYSDKLWYAAKEIKDIFTLDLGGLSAHYFIAKTNPARMHQAVIIKRVGKEYYLSDIIESNIILFLNSDNFMNNLVDMWEKQIIKSSEL